MNIALSGRAAAAATAVLLLSSCGKLTGGSEFLDQSPRDIAKAAFADMRDVTSLRMLGRVETTQGYARVDIRLDDAGNCAGSMTFPFGGWQLVKNKEGAWFKADEKFWRSQSSSPQHAEQVLARYGGSWLALKDKAIEEMCDLPGLLGEFKLTKRDAGDLITKDGADVEVIGESDTVAIDGRDGKDRSTLWISVDSPHHVLKVAPTYDTGDAEAIFFEDFGVKVVAETPAKKDIAKLQ